MENLKTFLKKPNLKLNGSLFGFGTSPEADWKVIFVSSAVLAISFVIFSVYIFIKIDKGEIFVSKQTTEQEGQILDTALFKETISYYEAKALEFKEMKKVEITAVDPSL